MNIQTVSNYSFRGQSAAQTNQKPKGGAGKAVASFFIPGLGEFLDGRNKEGAMFLGSRLAVSGVSLALGSKIAKDTFTTAANGLDGKDVAENVSQLAKTSKAAKFAVPILSLASLGLTIANVVDAYKGGHSEKADETK